jgi:hypothetical protein
MLSAAIDVRSNGTGTRPTLSNTLCEIEKNIDDTQRILDEMLLRLCGPIAEQIRNGEPGEAPPKILLAQSGNINNKSNRLRAIASQIAEQI